MFTILCLLCLCRNREYPGNFQNKIVIRKLLFQMSAQVKWEGMPFWSGQEAQIYPLNYLLPRYRGNINCYRSVHHPIPTLPMGTGSTLVIFKLKGKERYFLEGCKRGDHIARLSQDYHLIITPFVKFETILPLNKFFKFCIILHCRDT